jgi:hypothetical protein
MKNFPPNIINPTFAILSKDYKLDDNSFSGQNVIIATTILMFNPYIGVIISPCDKRVEQERNHGGESHFNSVYFVS